LLTLLPPRDRINQCQLLRGHGLDPTDHHR
jgi:hypothetical protein